MASQTGNVYQVTFAGTTWTDAVEDVSTRSLAVNTRIQTAGKRASTINHVDQKDYQVDVTLVDHTIIPVIGTAGQLIVTTYTKANGSGDVAAGGSSTKTRTYKNAVVTNVAESLPAQGASRTVVTLICSDPAGVNSVSA